MIVERMPNSDIAPGMMLYGWSAEARREQGNLADLQRGPRGIWDAMVVSNTFDVDPLDHDTQVHRIMVLFTNGSNMRLSALLLAWGGKSRVIR